MSDALGVCAPTAAAEATAGAAGAEITTAKTMSTERISARSLC